MGTASAAIMLWSMLLSQSTQPVRVVGADNGRLTLSQSSRSFDRLVLLESTSDKAAALKLGAAVLRTATGGPVDAKVELAFVVGDREAQQAELPALGQLWLRIKTELREDGSYDLPVPLAVDDRPLTFMFSLHRIKAAATVEVVGAQTVDTRCVRNDGEEGVCFWLTVNELAGHRQQMRLPTLLSLSRRENGNRLAAPRGELKVEGVNPAGWSLEPDASLPIQLFVTGLSRPGEYEGTIRFAAKDGQPVDRGFTVLLRDSLWVLFAFVFGGVAGSALLRWLIRFKVVGGTRRVEVLEKQERHGRSASALRTKTARELWSAIQARLSRAQETIANLSGAEARAMLLSLENELELFEEYLRAESIKGLIPIDSELASAMESARRELSTPNPSPEAALSALRSRTAAALGNAEKSLVALVDGLLVDAVGLEDARCAPVLDAIKRAKEEKVLTGLLEAATAQQNLIRGWVEQLSAEYSAPDPALKSLSAAFLQRLGYVQAQAALNPTEARRTLRGIREDALKARLDWLAPKVLAAEEAGFAEVKTAFALTPALPREQPLTEREATVRRWMALFRDRAPQSAALGSLEKVEKVELGELWPPSPQALPASKLRKKLLSQVNGYSVLVSLALAVIATLSAAGAFWAPNSLWGSSPLDYLTAFLWGLGVHQVGGASIESLESLSKRFGGNIE